MEENQKVGVFGSLFDGFFFPLGSKDLYTGKEGVEGFWCVEVCFASLLLLGVLDDGLLTALSVCVDFGDVFFCSCVFLFWVVMW